MSEVLITDKASRIAPAISGSGTSGFVVVWNESTGVNLKARMLSADGEPFDGEFQVNQTRDSIHPVATMAAEGFAIAWIAKGPPARVLMQRFREDGMKLDGEIQVSSTPGSPIRR